MCSGKFVDKISTALNLLTSCKKLARTSKTPGCTQLINFFGLDEQRRLVDLPGYGYAKASKAKKSHWQAFLPQYLLKRQGLRGVVWLMDIRHPLTATDQQFLSFVIQRQLPALILLTKADKLAKNAQQRVRQAVKEALAAVPFDYQVLLFSATHKIGVLDAQTWVLARLQEEFVQ